MNNLFKLFTLLLILINLKVLGQDSRDKKTNDDCLCKDVPPPGKLPLKNYYRNCTAESTTECTREIDHSNLIYDFKSKNFYFYKHNKWQVLSNPKSLKPAYNEAFTIKVLNINRYLYHVNLGIENIHFESEEPDLFKKFFLLSDLSISDVMPKTTDGKQGFKEGEDSIQTTEERFKKDYAEFRSAYLKLLESKMKAYSYCCEEIPCCNDTDRKVSYSNISKQIMDLKLLASEYNSDLIIQKALEEKKLLDYKVRYDNAKKSKKEKEMNKILNDSIESQLIINKIQTNIVKLETLRLTFDSLTEDDLFKLILFHNNLVADHFTFVSPPIYPQGNSLSINLKFEPSKSFLNKNLDVMPLYTDSLSIELFVRNKWFVSFSTGPYLPFGNSMRDEQVSWEYHTTSGVVRDTSSKKLKINETYPGIGLCALANIQTKLSPGFGLGGSLGAGLTLEKDPRTSFLLGVSTLFGKEKQFVLSGGLTLTQVNRVKLLNQENILYSASFKPDIQETKEFKSGGFISITYTPFKLNKSETTSSN